MPFRSISNLSGQGFVADLAPSKLPAEAFNEVRNVAFRDGNAERAPGYARLAEEYEFDEPPLATAPALWENRRTVLVATDSSILVLSGDTFKDVSRDDGYSAEKEEWTWTNANGGAILNNATDVPQWWDPQGGEDNKMQDLPNWPSGETCSSLRAYKGYLVAVGPNDGSGYGDQRVKWSDIWVPGDDPPTWEPDTDNQAGSQDLIDTTGKIVDCLPLRDVNIVHKTDSLWQMQFVGGQYVFRFTRLSTFHGILAVNCAANTPLGQVILTTNDVVLVNGSQIQSIASQRVRRWLFSEIDPTAYERSFVATNARDKEVWVVFPENGEDYPTKMLVWNWSEDVWSVRDAPGFRGSGLTPLDPQPPGVWAPEAVAWEEGGDYDRGLDDKTWDELEDDWADFYGDSPEWQEEDIPWVSGLLGQSILRPAVARTVLDDDGNFERGEILLGSLGLSPVREDDALILRRDFLPVNTESGADYSTVKVIRSLIFKGRGEAEAEVRLGVRPTETSAIEWTDWRKVVLSEDSQIDFPLTGKLFSLEIRAEGNNDFFLEGLDVEYKVVGRY